MEGTGAAPSAPSAPSGTSAPSPTPSNAAPPPSSSPAPASAPSSEPTPPSFASLDDLGGFVKSRGGKVRIKANGEEQDVDWDEAQRYLPLGKGAYKKFEEAQAIQKAAEERYQQAEQIARLVFEAPDEALRRMTPEQRQEWLRRIAGGLEEAELPAEKRELLEAKRELERYKREAQEREERTKQAQLSQQEQTVYDNAQRVFAGAMDKAGEPADPAYRRQLMARMAGVARRAMANGVDIGIDQVLEIARGELHTPAREVMRGASIEKIEEWLGEERIKAIYGRAVSRWKKADPIGEVEGGKSARTAPAAPPPPPIHTIGDYSAYLDSLQGRKR